MTGQNGRGVGRRSRTGREHLSQLDGVVMVDPLVLDALLGVIGEVEVEGRIFGQGAALTYMLSEQYVTFDTNQSGERRDVSRSNHGGSILDAVVELAVQVDIDRTDDSTIVTYDITVTNNADPAGPEYVAGP